MLIGLAFATAVGVFLGALSPFGSYEHGTVAQRMAYWVGMGWVSGLIMTTALYLAERFAPRWAPRWLAVLVAILIGSAPIAFLARLVSFSMWPELKTALGTGNWYWQCVVLSVPIAGGFWWFLRGRHAGAAPPTVTAENAHLDEAICLQMEDHYVRVHTAKGSYLVLMRLSDAIQRVGREGLQVHRSWWVARDAIEACVVDGRKLRLRLTNGVEAPVARTAVARVREAGLLAG